MASTRYADEFINALIEEIDNQRDYLNNEAINTIYFGGGTPSLLSADTIKRIADALHKNFSIESDAEITLEANPDDISVAYLNDLRSTFINRFSMGVQSFFDDDLNYLNRVHTGENALNAIHMAQDAGYEKLTIDLIYGIPGLTNAKWEANLATFLKTEITHLSAYALTVEENTALDKLIARGKMKAVDEHQSASQLEYLMQRMHEAGFIHYEISNFAKAGHYSRHNSLYWLGGHYLGLGPSAHSFNGYSRQWNVANIAKYIQNVRVEERIEEKEILSLVQRYDEYVMTSLRTEWGCDLEHIENVFGTSYRNYCLQQAEKYIRTQKIEKRGNSLFLSSKGKLFADGIAADLFMTD